MCFGKLAKSPVDGISPSGPRCNVLDVAGRNQLRCSLAAAAQHASLSYYLLAVDSDGGLGGSGGDELQHLTDFGAEAARVSILPAVLTSDEDTQLTSQSMLQLTTRRLATASPFA